MTRWLHTEHCPRSLRGWQLGSQDASPSPLLCNNRDLEQIPDGMFHISMGYCNREIGSKPPTHSLLHWNESPAKNIEMSVGPKTCQNIELTWIQGSNVFIPFPAQGPSHSLSKSENHDELFRPVEIAKKNPTVWKPCKIFRKSCLLSVWVLPLMFPTLLALHTNLSNRVRRMFG